MTNGESPIDPVVGRSPGSASGWTVSSRRCIASRIPALENSIVSPSGTAKTSRLERAGRTSTIGVTFTPGSLGVGSASGVPPFASFGTSTGASPGALPS